MSKGFVYQEIGGRIRELRGRERQKDWAQKIGCDQGYISQVENGVTKPSLAFLRGVASMTNANIDWILTGRGPVTGPGSVEPSQAGKGGRGNNGEDVLRQIAGSPRLLAGINKLMKSDGPGRGVLEAIGEMDEQRIAGLAALIGITKKQ